MSEQTVDERLLALLERQQSTMAEQVARTAPKENPNYVARSEYLKPDGEPWATDLKCEMFFGPIRLNRTPLTRDEVTMLNQIGPVEKATIRKLDGSISKVTVRPREDAVGRLERLTIELPLRREDNPMHYPSLWELASQLAAQVPA